MKKQFLATVLGCAMSLSLFGCANNAPAKTEEKAPETEEAANPLIRNTQFGQVEGFEENGVDVFYGVPYGMEPEGELRWQAPVDPEAWDAPLDCKEKEEVALQAASVTDEDGNTTVEAVGTTNSLTMDIYTSAEAQKAPVVVFVHGGNNQTGNSFEIPGNDMVKKDGIVYVSVNYRLGLLGFNNLPALLDDHNNTGNFSMLDLAKSLQWVRDNIENFGGDSQNVTISGFSAGGRDVMAMLVSPTFKGLFDKAIAYSGGMTIADSTDSMNMIAKTMAPLVVEDGKAADEEEAKEFLLTDSDEVRDYLYGLEAGRIVKLFPNAGIRMAKFPHLYNDGVVLPEGGFENAEYVNDVPLIMVTGSEEFSMFGLFDPSIDSMKDVDASKRFINYYGGEFYRNFNTQLSAEKMGSYKSNMYLCQINYGDENSGYQIPTFGAFHGIFVPLISAANNYAGLYDFSEASYQELSKAYNEYLLSFLQTGTPSSQSAGVEWNAWKNDARDTLVLDGKDGKAVIEVKDVYKSNADIIKEIEADPLDENDKKTIISTILNGRWFSADLDAHFKTPSLWN
ncbi:MAG: carboxylesterase/lipase family protein [Firmicutes bacterium]|nr:carboxylesterase/lipase family protein [Bacillota bacterium]